MRRSFGDAGSLAAGGFALAVSRDASVAPASTGAADPESGSTVAVGAAGSIAGDPPQAETTRHVSVEAATMREIMARFYHHVASPHLNVDAFHARKIRTHFLRTVRYSHTLESALTVGRRSAYFSMRRAP